MANFDDLLNNDTPAGQQGNQQLSKEGYAAKKQAERESVYVLADSTAIDIVNDGGRFKQFLDVQAKFDRYSAVNALLIFAQKPESTRIGSFDFWKSQGGSVKQGQAGISILEPGKEYERKDGNGTAVSYNIKKVFDISQVDTRKVKAAPPLTPFNDRQLLKALIHKAPMKISGVDKLPGDLGAMTNPGTGEISIRKGMAFSDTFRSVANELCHAEAASDDTISDAQFTAYCASYILCKKYGVDTKGYSFDNVADMLAGLDSQAVKRELSQARDTANTISGRMARQLDAVAKAARVQEAR